MRNIATAAALLLLFTLPALAQTNPPTANPPIRVRGTVEKLDGQVLTVKTRDGQSLAITLAPNHTVAALVKKSLSDIKQGDYLASAGVKGTDGKIHATEVRIFPEAMRGGGEGQRPWDQGSDSVMTNATLTGTAGAPNGQVLTVTYKGTTSEYIVGPECPIFGYTQGDDSLLKPGAAVFLSAEKGPDGNLTASRLTAEKDGVKPPM